MPDISSEMFEEFLRVAWAAWTMMPQGQPETRQLKDMLDKIDPLEEKVRGVIARNKAIGEEKAT